MPGAAGAPAMVRARQLVPTKAAGVGAGSSATALQAVSNRPAPRRRAGRVQEWWLWWCMRRV